MRRIYSDIIKSAIKSSASSETERGARSRIREGRPMVRLSAGEKKKRLIIGVCKKLFYRNGYVGTTYEDICREADIPPGTITYHFDGKAGNRHRDRGGVRGAEQDIHREDVQRPVFEDAASRHRELPHVEAHLRGREHQALPLGDHDRAHPVEVGARRRRVLLQVRDGGSGHRGHLRETSSTSSWPRSSGLSDALVGRTSAEPERFTYEEVAHFATRFFLRQIGMSDGKIEACIEDGKEIFDRLPIDNRYYVDFRYDDRYVAKLPGVKE